MLLTPKSCIITHLKEIRKKKRKGRKDDTIMLFPSENGGIKILEKISVKIDRKISLKKCNI